VISEAMFEKKSVAPTRRADRPRDDSTGTPRKMSDHL